MRDDVIGKIFERGTLFQVNRGFENRGFLFCAIYARGGRRRQANVRPRFLHDFRLQAVATQNSTSRVQKHQVRRAIGEGKRREHLERQGKARLCEDRAVAAARESKAQKSVSPNAPRISFTAAVCILLVIQRAGNGGSIR